MNKKNLNKTIYKSRISLAIVIFVITIITFSGFYPKAHNILSLQLGPQLINVITAFSITALAATLIIFALTLIFGRFYCSVICPFGHLQEILAKCFKHKPKPLGNFYKTRYIIACAVIGLLVGGSTLGFKLLDPYTNFGTITSAIFKHEINLALIQGAIVFSVIAILVYFKNRIFCTTLCPIGTILGIFSKYSILQLKINTNCVKCKKCEQECPVGCINDEIIDNERCIKCFKCISDCPQQSIEYKKSFDKKDEIGFNPKRRAFLFGCAVLGVTLASAKTGMALAKSTISLFKKRPVLPPGAGPLENFVSKCTNCNLCVNNCSGKVIKSPDFENETVHLDFNAGYCKYNCSKCNNICPTGALKKLTKPEKKQFVIGKADINLSHCVGCGSCISQCPTGALSRKNANSNVPQVNEKLCIGCGACAFNCPVKAININPKE